MLWSIINPYLADLEHKPGKWWDRFREFNKFLETHRRVPGRREDPLLMGWFYRNRRAVYDGVEIEFWRTVAFISILVAVKKPLTLSPSVPIRECYICRASHRVPVAFAPFLDRFGFHCKDIFWAPPTDRECIPVSSRVSSRASSRASSPESSTSSPEFPDINETFEESFLYYLDFREMYGTLIHPHPLNGSNTLDSVPDFL